MICIGYVHRPKVHHAFLDSLLALPRAESGLVRIAVSSGPLIASNRNQIVATTLDLDPKVSHLLMVDTDISFTYDDVESLLNAGKPIVSALYYGRHAWGGIFPVGHLLRDGVPRKLEEDDLVTEPFPVAGVGMGFCMIEREVLEALRPIRALWPFAEVERNDVACGEDLTFCLRAADAGFTTWLDPRVEVRHHKEWVL